MNQSAPAPGDDDREAMFHDDIVLPFQIETGHVRGRIARLGTLVDTVLTRHDYPESVSHLLGEALVLTVMLGSALKFDGKFTLQAQGDGPVSLLVADFATPGQVRGYARVDNEALEELAKAEGGANGGGDERLPVSKMLGKGHLALTIDQGADMDRYQGIVELKGDTLAETAHEYFRQSEQIDTFIHLAVAKVYTPDRSDGVQAVWRAGGLMLQNLAEEGGRPRDLPPGDAPEGAAEGAEEELPEDWSRATILAETVEDHELLDPMLETPSLLYRLFHEDGVRAFHPISVKFECRCSRSRVENVLNSFSKAELADMTEEGMIKVRCEFCNAAFDFAPDEVGQDT